MSDSRGMRIGWIEWARALGACAIVLLHVLVSTALATELEVGRQLAYAVVGIALCRWAVPAFFMVTGFLLLDPSKDVSWASVRRYVSRMALVLLSFGLAFALMEEAWVRVSAGEPLGLDVLVAALVDVLTAQTWDHLWYVYALMGVYLLVPGFRALRQRFGESGLAWCSAVLFVLVLAVPTWLGGLDLPPLATFLHNVAIGATCLCVGGCLRGWRLSVGWVVVGAGSLAAMLVVSMRGVMGGDGDQGFVFLQGSCFACAYAVLVLLALRRVCGGAKPPALVLALARDSFGVYVLHPLFVHVALMAIDPMACVPVAYELGLSLAVLVASVVATRLMRRLPSIGALL